MAHKIAIQYLSRPVLTGFYDYGKELILAT
jgi:hypothetical protein